MKLQVSPRIYPYMTLAYVDGLVPDGIRIEQSEDAAAKYKRSSVWVEEATDVMMRGIRCTPPRGETGLPVVMLHDVDRVLVTGSMALPGTKKFLQTTGNASHVTVEGISSAVGWRAGRAECGALSGDIGSRTAVRAVCE